MSMRSSVSKREKKLIIFTILVAILGVLYAFIVEPLYKKYININQEIKIKQVRLAKNLKLMREKDAITEDFKRYDQRLKKTTSREEEMASVLSEIENIGKTAGVYLSDVKPQRTKDMAFYRMLLV